MDNQIKIKYCKNCVMPETKPDLFIDESGICNACRSYEQRKNIDWDQRKKELIAILDKYRSKDKSNYDCIVPVSGGKDSFYQVIKMLELGMNPLCVTGTTCRLSDIGRRNIEALKNLGVDYIEITANKIIRKKINRLTLRQVGDIGWPEHVTIFTAPIRAAVQNKVPLLIWGENAQNEYGGPAQAAENNVLDRRWLEEFGGLLGLRVSDLIGQEGIEKKHLIHYTYPTDEDIQKVGVTGLYLGYYLPWDGLRNSLIAQSYGFETYGKSITGQFTNYENLDNHYMGIHDYFKFLKFAFGRASDLVSMHIRRGRLSREEGIDIIKRLDGKFPWTYLDMPIEKMLEEIDMSLDEFIKICDKFTNKKLFLCDANGNLKKDKDGNLTKINYDNI